MACELWPVLLLQKKSVAVVAHLVTVFFHPQPLSAAHQWGESITIDGTLVFDAPHTWPWQALCVLISGMLQT